MLQSAVGKRLEAEDRLDWTAFYMDEFQRHERVQERGDGFCVMGVTEEDIGLADTVIGAEE